LAGRLDFSIIAIVTFFFISKYFDGELLKVESEAI
jgi:hypothetical protein